MMKISTSFFLHRVLAMLLLSASVQLNAHANTFNVTQTTDGNDPSQLRGAILAADALGGGPHTINVPAGTYNLTLGTIEFGNNAQNISIIGTGPGSTVINMTTTMQGRIFFINSSGTVSGVTTTISGIKFTGGKNSDSYGGGAILCGGPGNVTNITNCTFEGNVAEVLGGGALSMAGGGALTVDNCTFHDNKILSTTDNATGGAILISYYNSTITTTGSATITNSTFTNNLATSGYFTYGGAIGLRAVYSASSPSFYTKIEKNKFLDNSTGMTTNSEGGAISVISSFAVDINYNVFTGNKLGNSVKDALSVRKSVDGAVNATNNWWGCNTDPQAGGTCSEPAYIVDGLGTATLTTNPWLVLKPAVDNASLCVPSASQTTVTGSFLNNSAGSSVALSNLSQLIGLPVSFSAVNGNISNAQASIQADGKATATYTASGAGNGSANVMVGYLTNADPTGRVAITTGALPNITSSPEKVTTCPGTSSVNFSVTASSTTTMSYQWYNGDTPLMNNARYSGVNSATLTVHNIIVGDHGGQYKVKITNACGDIFSTAVGLNVLVGRLYVAEGASGEGSGWGDALGDLSNALNIAAGCPGITEIWVKKGTYKPSGQPYNLNLGGARHNAFYLISNVSIYGGFKGDETQLSARNAGAHQTVLSGDIGSAGDADNSYHVIVAVNTNLAARLDGFIVRDGNADGTGLSASISGVPVDATGGGGIALYSSSPTIANCVFTNNKANNGGGILLFGDGTAPTISQCVISDNSGTSGGGGIFNGFNSEATIQHCTVARNTSTVEGAGIYNMLLSTPSILNTVVWGNSGQAPAGIYDLISTPVVAHSIVQDGHSGTGVVNTDALFVAQSDPDGADNQWMTADDGLRLSPCSPGINAGLFAGNIPPTDILGLSRVFDVTADMGAYELQSYRDGSSLSVNGDAVSQAIVAGTSNGFLVSGCRVIAQVTPSGPAPVSGSVQAKTFVEGGVITTEAVKFVQRHYEILPADNAGSATARIKLFFLQSEFDAFNSTAGGIQLPTSPSDGTGKANLLVVQYHGTSATGQPGSYSGNVTTINPDDNDISWNSDLNRWEIAFDVTGFSGFFVSNVDPLPLTLVSFKAEKVENTTQLEWLTAEEFNTSHFEIHRSSDARHWEILPGQPAATGSGGHRYFATDYHPQAGLNYYRLKMVDLDGSYALSQIVAADHGNGLQMQVYPNPVTTLLQLEMTGADSGNATLTNTNGVVVVRKELRNGRVELPVVNLAKGIYVLRVQTGSAIHTKKVAIE
ncbi:right-handed parallel beta-helix repeat-containing protein [Dyadobacter soli]|nr:right-handed parallel beta-helix repeat-containing protein [Dyadobacter soli]